MDPIRGPSLIRRVNRRGVAVRKAPEAPLVDSKACDVNSAAMISRSQRPKQLRVRLRCGNMQKGRQRRTPSDSRTRTGVLSPPGPSSFGARQTYPFGQFLSTDLERTSTERNLSRKSTSTGSDAKMNNRHLCHPSNCISFFTDSCRYLQFIFEHLWNFLINEVLTK